MAYSLDYVKSSKIILYLYHGLLLTPIVLTTFTSNHIYHKYIAVYKYLIILFATYYFYLLFMGIYNKKAGAIPITIGYLCLVAGAIAELFIGNMPYVLAYSTFLMVGIFTVTQIVAFSSIKTRKETLESEIIIDKLTLIYNRLYLEKILADSSLEKHENHSWYVLFIDLNHFWIVNTYLVLSIVS